VIGTLFPPGIVVSPEYELFNAASLLLLVTENIGQFSLSSHTTIYSALSPRTGFILVINKVPRNSNKLSSPKLLS
jgi:hypothetical protein